MRTRLPWQCEIASGACRSLTPKLMYYVIRGSIHPLSAFVHALYERERAYTVCACVCAHVFVRAKKTAGEESLELTELR